MSIRFGHKALPFSPGTKLYATDTEMARLSNESKP